MANWHPAVAAQSGQDRWLRTDQAALRLECDESTIRRLCRSKVLRGIKKGRRKWLISESAIRDYLDSLTKNSKREENMSEDKRDQKMTWQEKVAAAQEVVNLLKGVDVNDALDVVRLALVDILPGRNVMIDTIS
jgi:excisionase family DNA binding protein